MKITTQWVQASTNVKLFVEGRGDKRRVPIILVHGYPDNHHIWDRVAEQLAEQYYVVTYDVRGAGQSTAPSRIRDYRLEELAKDLAAVHEQVLDGRAFHLIGHDWGSIQCWESVTTARLDGQILSFTSISGPSLDHAAIWMRDRAKDEPLTFLQQLTKSWYIVVFQLPVLAPLAWKTILGNRWHKMMAKLEGVASFPINPTQISDGAQGVNLYRANFMSKFLNPKQRHAHCPVHAIVFEHDAFVGPALMNDLSRWVDDLTVNRLASGHWGVMSQSNHVADLIQSYLADRAKS